MAMVALAEWGDKGLDCGNAWRIEQQGGVALALDNQRAAACVTCLHLGEGCGGEYIRCLATDHHERAVQQRFKLRPHIGHGVGEVDALKCFT